MSHKRKVLVLGNVVLQFAFPYILVVLAIGKQHLATIAAISEASVNIVISIWLVQKIGAIGVAIGTLSLPRWRSPRPVLLLGGRC
jgi:O-antigen/teichoic acid export membrane protein